MSVEITSLHLSDRTIGVLEYEDFRCYTLELPWKFNQKNISCIPGGTYEAIKMLHHRFVKAIQILHVPDRSEILIHPGNFTHQIEGCILVGSGLRDIDGDNRSDVTNSIATLQRLWAMLPDRFNVRIRRHG